MLKFLLIFALTASAAAQNVVHFCYLVPADKTNNPEAATAIANAALHLQAWYQSQLDGRKTFTLNDPIVETYQSAHASSWYSASDAGTDSVYWFFYNCINDAGSLVGGFNLDTNDWVIYVDAEPSPTQYAGGSSGNGMSGIAVMGSKDIRSLMGQDPEWTQCRGIGGSGHELGHTFGLPHPIGDPNWETALMGIGYLIYPYAILTQDEKDTLAANPFFTQQHRINPPRKLCPFH